MERLGRLRRSLRSVWKQRDHVKENAANNSDDVETSDPKPQAADDPDTNISAVVPSDGDVEDQRPTVRMRSKNTENKNPETISLRSRSRSRSRPRKRPCRPKSWVGMPSPKSAEDLDDGGVFDISVVQPSSGSCVKKGVLAMQRDRGLLSRWRDRYFMLMPDYLACFKKSSSAPVRGFPAGSGMGSFQFKLSLVDIESAEWADGTGLVIALNVKNDARLLLRCVGDGRDVGNSPGNAGHGSPAGFFPLTHSASTPTVVASAAAAAAAVCTTPGQLKDWLRAIQSAVSCSKTRREALRNANRSGFDPTALKQRIVYERSVLDATDNGSLVKDTAKDPLSPLNHSVSILQAQQTRLMSNKVDKKYQRFSLLPDLNLSRYLDSWGFGSSSSSTNNRTPNVTGSASPANSDSSCSSTSSGGSTSSASSTSSRDSGIGNGTNGYHHHQSSTPSPLASSAVLAAASKRGNRYDMRPQSYADPLCTTDSPGTQPVLVKFRDRSTGENNIRLYVNSPSSSPIKAGPSSNSSPARHVYVSPATHV